MPPKKPSEYHRQYRENRGEKWRMEQNKRVQKWQKTHAGKWSMKAGGINTAAKIRGNNDKVSGKELASLSRKCGHPDCNRELDISKARPFQRFNIDHIVPLVSGGTNTIRNLWILCKEHHKEKSSNEKTLKAYPSSTEKLDWISNKEKSVSTFGNQSRKNLYECREPLIRLFEEVVKNYDCSIIEGQRSEVEQEKLFHSGKSKVRWPDSKHNVTGEQPLSRAVDVIPYPTVLNGVSIWEDWNRFYHFIGYVKGVAATMGINIRCGADWDGDHSFRDQSFHDLPHVELIIEGSSEE